MGTVMVVALASIAALLPAEPQTTIVQGSIIRLESVQDQQAMASMAPGETIEWDVGVSASEPDGTLDVTLSSAVRAPAFEVSVRACDGTFESAGCSGVETTLIEAATPAGTLQIAAQPSSATVWYRIEVSLVDEVDAARAELVLRVTGQGESVESGGAVTLPETGASVVQLVPLAVAALGAGLLLAWLARSRRTAAGSRRA